MALNEFQRELAQNRVDAEVRCGVGRMQEALRAGGQETCIACGELIPMKRRIAMPSAKHCLDCKNTMERR